MAAPLPLSLGRDMSNNTTNGTLSVDDMLASTEEEEGQLKANMEVTSDKAFAQHRSP